MALNLDEIDRMDVTATDRLARVHTNNPRMARVVETARQNDAALFIIARPKADRLVYVLLNQLGELDADAAKVGRDWYDAVRAGLTVAKGSDFITRIRGKIADAVTASTPTDRINAALAVNPRLRVDVNGDCRACRFIGDPNCRACRPVTTPAPRVKNPAWATWRDMATKLAATGGHPSGTRFAIDNIDQSTNDVSFWWVSVSKTGFAKIRQVIGGQGAVDVRMPVESMIRIGQRIIDAGPHAAMVRYGMLLGHCGDCGRELTNAESRAAGIGPKCRTRGTR